MNFRPLSAASPGWWKATSRQSETRGAKRGHNHESTSIIIYDFFHEQVSEGNLIEKLEKNIAKVGLMHVADVPGRHEPGTGEINYTNIYKKLAALKYDRYLAMEFIPTGDPVASLRRAREEALRAGG
jgi:hydroxypyruvate isomerase